MPQASASHSVVTGALDIYADPDCGGATDTDIALSNSLAWTTPWPQVAVQATKVGMFPGAKCPSNSSKVTGSSPEARGSCGLWRYKEP